MAGTGDTVSVGGMVRTLADKSAVAGAKPDKELTDPDLAFLKSLNPEASLPELKERALQNYANFMGQGGIKYNCFRALYHLLPAITDHYLYSSLIKGPSNRFLIDLGGGQATDARKLIQDGWPADKILITDVDTFLWRAGLDLFQDGPKGPVPFIQADLLKEADTEAGGPLHGLLHSADVVYAQAVLHLFNEPTVSKYATRAMELLKPGGLFFGANGGSSPPGRFGMENGKDILESPWCHSPESFKSALEQLGYEDVKVETCGFTDFIRRRGFGKPIWDFDMSKPFGDDRELLWMSWSATKPVSNK